MDCTRKHTLVTGCSSGIGRATALRLAAAGQHVYAGVRNLGDGVQLARSASGGELTPVILDVTDASHIAAATAAIAEHTTAAGRDGLDGLVNNAAFGLACPAELVQLDAFRRQLEVNVTGQLAVTQAFLPSLRRALGRIVMVSTIGVRFTPPFAGPLDATKAALAALGDALRQELAPWGVRVVLIEPTSINSGAADKVSRDAAAAMAAAGPQGRALYEDTFGKMLGVMQRREENGSPPDVAAATITRALMATRPRSLYLTGKNSRRLAILSKLPTPIIDAARRRIFQLPRPRFPGGRRQPIRPGGDQEMMAEFGRLLWQATRCCGRALRDLYGDLEQASECYWLSSRAAVPRSGPMAWVPSLDGYRLVGSHLPEPGPPADASSSSQP